MRLKISILDIHLIFGEILKDADLDTKVSVFSLPEKPCGAGLFPFGWVHEMSFPPVLWAQKASYAGFPLLWYSGWVHDKTAAVFRAGSRFILGAYEVFLKYRV